MPSPRFQVMLRCPVSGHQSVTGRGTQLQPGPVILNPDSKALWLQPPVGRRLLGQGRGGTGPASPSGLPPCRLLLRRNAGHRIGSRCGLLGPPTTGSSPALPFGLSSHCPGEFSMCSWLGQESRGLGLGLLGRSEPLEVKCPFGGERALRWGHLGWERGGGRGRKARTAPTGQVWQ